MKLHLTTICALTLVTLNLSVASAGINPPGVLFADANLTAPTDDQSFQTGADGHVLVTAASNPQSVGIQGIRTYTYSVSYDMYILFSGTGDIVNEHKYSLRITVPGDEVWIVDGEGSGYSHLAAGSQQVSANSIISASVLGTKSTSSVKFISVR